jgi:RNA polymerase sigma factor (sigma-70 family)
MTSGDGGVTARSARDFPVTSWTLLSIVQAGGADARAALGELIARYSAAVEAFLRDALRVTPEDAQDVAQDFFADKILSGHLLARYRRGKGSFRPYLKEALRNYVRSRLRTDAARKRRPDGGMVSPDDLPRGWDSVEPGPASSPESAFHTAWVRRLLDEALAVVRAQCVREGLEPHFAVFAGRYLSDADEPKWSELAAPYGWDEKQARNRAEVVAARFRTALRELVAAEVGSEQLAQEELEALLALL